MVAFPVKWPGARGRAEYFAPGRAESIVRQMSHALKRSSLRARSSLNCLVERNRSALPNGRAKSLNITNRRAESTYVSGWSSEAARPSGLSSASARQMENAGRTRARGNSRRAVRWEIFSCWPSRRVSRSAVRVSCPSWRCPSASQEPQRLDLPPTLSTRADARQPAAEAASPRRSRSSPQAGAPHPRADDQLTFEIGA